MRYKCLIYDMYCQFILTTVNTVSVCFVVPVVAYYLLLRPKVEFEFDRHAQTST